MPVFSLAIYQWSFLSYYLNLSFTLLSALSARQCLFSDGDQKEITGVPGADKIIVL